MDKHKSHTVHHPQHHAANNTQGGDINHNQGHTIYHAKPKSNSLLYIVIGVLILLVIVSIYFFYNDISGAALGAFSSKTPCQGQAVGSSCYCEGEESVPRDSNNDGIYEGCFSL